MRSGDQVSSVLIQPELGYSFHRRWMIWGELRIDVIDRLSIVGQRLNIRYAILKLKPVEFYAGLDYERVEKRSLNPGGGNSKRTGLFIGPMAGYLHFIQPNTAVELQLRYPVYRSNKVWDNVQKFNGTMGLQLAFRFFFPSKLPKDSVIIESEISAKDWMIGGAVGLAGHDLLGELRNTFVNNVSPYAGYFFSKRWMLGLRLLYSNSRTLERFNFGGSPFVRYYFMQKPRMMMYTELTGNLQFVKDGNNPNANQTELLEKSTGIGVGWNKCILPKLCLDIHIGSKWFQELGYDRKRWIDYQKIYLRMGLERFF